MIVLSCQTPYVNSNLDAQEQLIVVEAKFTNTFQNDLVKIYYATPYTETSTTYINDAVVTIANDNGELITLHADNNGYYSSDESLELDKNTDYWIEIGTNNNLITSIPQQVNDTLAIDAIFSEPYIQSTTSKNEYGEYTTIDKEGVLVSMRLQQPDQTSYYRIHSDYYVHATTSVSSTKEITINNPYASSTYQVKLDTTYDIYVGVSNSDFPISGVLYKNQNYSNQDLTIDVIFLEADPDCYDFSQFTEYEFIEWIFPIELYTTNETSYQYYKDAEDILNAEDQIFDPIPSQLTGNMFCVNNTQEAILGLCEFSNINRRYYSVYLYESLGYRMYRGKYSSMQDLKSGWYIRNTSSDTVLISSTIH